MPWTQCRPVNDELSNPQDVIRCREDSRDTVQFHFILMGHCGISLNNIRDHNSRIAVQLSLELALNLVKACRLCGVVAGQAGCKAKFLKRGDPMEPREHV